MSNQLIVEQRYAIYLGLEKKRGEKVTLTQIAEAIDVSVSTVSREIRRNSKSVGTNVWLHAQKMSDSRRHGFKGNHRKSDELWWMVDSLIVDEVWSPEQIADNLRQQVILSNDCQSADYFLH